MKLSQKLLMVASWLEDADNDLLVNAESDEACLTVVADALVKAAEVLKAGAVEVSRVEPNTLTPEALEEMAAVAQAFDESGDELLKKQASVLDEILLTLAAPKNAIHEHKKAEDDRIEQLKKKYKDTKEQQDENIKVSDAIKAIEKSPYYKEYRPLEAPLSTRTCPDHPGALVARVGEHTWQCMLDKKIYNYDAGFTTMNGNKVPGGNVESQTPMQWDQGSMVFDTRESRLGLERK
jgi:hypothetical protein